MDLNAPCFTQEYSYCSDLLNPDVPLENDEYFVDICEADPGDDLGSLETWKKANPIRAYYQEGINKLASDYEVAKMIPEKMVAFMTKCLNIWVQATENGYRNIKVNWKAVS